MYPSVVYNNTPYMYLYMYVHTYIHTLSVSIADLYPTRSDPFETEPGLSTYIIAFQSKDGVAR